MKDYSTKLLDSYEKHKNQYHNQMHAADVAQTVHCLMNESGFMVKRHIVFLLLSVSQCNGCGEKRFASILLLVCFEKKDEG